MDTAKRMNKNDITQAIVIIHGIGEQKPMDTLRNFVDGVLKDEDGVEPKYFSKPDNLSESFELRKLQNRKRPRTHFYEYYWAYKSENNTFRNVLFWVSTLVIRSPRKVPAHLYGLFYLSWALIVLTGIAIIVGLYDSLRNELILIVDRFPPSLAVIVGFLLVAIFQLIIVSYLGDAARYLSPAARNIKLRHDIRADGIRLLRKLHESGEYERIVIVGHSLGSVIAYDILTHLWQEYHDIYTQIPSFDRDEIDDGDGTVDATSVDSNQELIDFSDETDVEDENKVEQMALEELEASGRELSATSQNDISKFEAKQKDYIARQKDLWWELHGLGMPWLVTDFITLGSPLAHAAILLAQNGDDFKLRKMQREIPTSPPQYDEDNGQRFSYKVDFMGNSTLRAIHHAGAFACTRWTNIYFRSHFGFFGDLVGGPLNPWFGNGIKDIAVNTDNRLRDSTILSHITYWSKQKKKPVSHALETLRIALDLEAEILTEE
jgi:hypothetical protein